MAYVPRQLPQDEENQFGRTAQTTPFPQPAGGGSAGTGTNAAPGMGTSTQFGSNAAKLSDYLKANEGQIGEFGNQVAGKLNEGYGNTMNAINQGSQDFGQRVSKGYAANNPNIGIEAAKDPYKFSQDPNNVSAFQSLYNDQYTGPSNFESSDIYGNLNDQVNKATENAGLVSSFGGLQSYLNNNMGGANRTQGMQTLDTALLQRSPEASQAIRTAAAPYQNLSSYLSGKTGEANQGIANAKTEAQKSSESLRKQFTGEGGVIPNFQNDINSRVSNLRSTSQDTLNKILSTLPGYTSKNAGPSVYTPEMNNVLGGDMFQRQALQEGGDLLSKWSSVNDEYGQPIFNPKDMDLTNYGTIRNPESSITASNVANPEDYQKYLALSKLTGSPDMNFLDQNNISQAGTAPSDLLDFDMSGALNHRFDQLRALAQKTNDPALQEIISKNYSNPEQLNQSLENSNMIQTNQGHWISPLPGPFGYGNSTPTPNPTDTNGLPPPITPTDMNGLPLQEDEERPAFYPI